MSEYIENLSKSWSTMPQSKRDALYHVHWNNAHEDDFFMTNKITEQKVREIVTILEGTPFSRSYEEIFAFIRPKNILIFNLCISETLLSVRAINFLHAEGIYYIGQLVQLTSENLKRLHHRGPVPFEEIIKYLTSYGLSLPMHVGSWTPPEWAPQESEQLHSIYNLTIENVLDMGFTIRTKNCLKAENIYYIGELVQKTENELLKSQNPRRICVNEIKEILAAYRLRLGTKVGNWVRPTTE